MKTNWKVLRVSAFSALAFGVMATLPSPTTAEVNFKNKNVTMIVGNAPGGGTDAVGRLVGEFLMRNLPGGPTLIVKNMPGAGGITALNYFANKVKPDGLTITTGASTQTDPVRWRAKASQYDPRKFRMIGGIIRGSTVLMLKKEAQDRLLDKSKPPVVVGAIDGTRSGIVMSMWGGKYLGWNIKWVVGYGGTSELMLALQRGEIDITSTANSFLIKELQGKGTHVILAQSGIPESGKIVSRMGFENIPIFPNEIKPKLKTELEKQAFGYWESINTTDKWMALPPGTPDDIVNAYEKAFLTAIKDPEFLKRGRATISEDIAGLPAADQDRLVQQLAATTDEALAYIDGIKKSQGLRVLVTKMQTVSTMIDAVKKKHRVLEFNAGGKKQTVRLSGGKTKVKIGGKESNRRKLKAGMSCDITYGKSGSTATTIVCK